MQTGMYASEALMPIEMQLSGLEGHQSPVMGFLKTAQSVRNEVENGVKVRTSDALGRRLCQSPSFECFLKNSSINFEARSGFSL